MVHKVIETDQYYIVESQEDIWKLAEHLRISAKQDIDTSQPKEVFKKFRQDYGYYAHRQLWIQPKDGDITRFSFNKGQWYLYAIAEWQLRTTGKVRIVIVKGRQQGISTWTEGRGYWKASQSPGCKAVVLAHESSASDNCFQMFKTYHDSVAPSLKPTVGKDNEKQFTFPRIKSSVKVFTSGKKGVGRGQTSNFFHGSEVAFWEHAYDHSMGIMQSISKGDGSEVYLESTAFGNTGLFADFWNLAHYPWEEPKPHGNGYVRCFIPWYWEPTYRESVPKNFEPTPEEMEIADLFGLDDEQLQWRRKKIGETGGDVARFMRDYPATPEEAFNSSLDNVLIQPMDVIRARKNYQDELSSYLSAAFPAVIGCDVAREGDDATCIAVRQGRVLLHLEQHYKKPGNFIAQRIMMLSQKFHVARAFIDNTGGFGGSVLDFLAVYGYDNAIGIHFSESAEDNDQFKNIRSEMWWKASEWIKDGAALPDSDEMQKDLCTPTYKYQGDKFLLESKYDMKKRAGKSPDIGDAIALTFAHRVAPSSAAQSYDPQEG